MDDEEHKLIKERVIEFYEVLLEQSIKKEDYEKSVIYKKYIDNLKKVK